jgi:tetratricopeptide (TPR) repeat protein
VPTLRLSQSSIGASRFRVEVSLEHDRGQRQVATSEFDFNLSDEDREGLRWYLEDFLQHIAAPAPQIASRVEDRIAEIGDQLFKSVFESSETARRLWPVVQAALPDTRIEIIADISQATAIPWELMRDPLTQSHLALQAGEFVRGQTDPTRMLPAFEETGDDARKVRILLVISRPSGGADVPFRSVASRLIKGLGQVARDTFELDVLRPPTFAQLSKVLMAAKTSGRPYHVVHFDGHGAYLDVADQTVVDGLRRMLSSLMLSSTRSGPHGYLLFENPRLPNNIELVDGKNVGELLWTAGVPILVLNACRSAHAEPPAAPQTDSEGVSVEARASNGSAAQIRAFGSLAQEVVNAGVPGVVAMRYNVYVVTAAQFVADLYEALAQGYSLGGAVTSGRRQLAAQPLREVGYEPRPLQDWMVPVVYESARLSLFPEHTDSNPLNIKLRPDATAPVLGAIDPELERRPDVGFFGRDETILALDRAFDEHSVVLLHAFAGSGKSSTAAEFARWYSLTGGVEGPILFTTFATYRSLTQILDAVIGRVFGPMLARNGVHWTALGDVERQDVALKVMALVPVLWVWDNVEPVAGFPAGTISLWSEEEQRSLADFLSRASRTKAKFLLTSRRDEMTWLGNLPKRLHVPPMPLQERLQLARAIALKHRRAIAVVEDWLPLMRFTRGNPLTITVLVGQALLEGLTTRTQLERFVEQLKIGEKSFSDESTEGRDRSLGASLNYGFAHAFNNQELSQIALLYLFQGVVSGTALEMMGDPDADWSLPALRGVTTDQATELLMRASEVGLLDRLGPRVFGIHPAVPWFLRELFDQHHSATHGAAIHAFEGAMAHRAAFFRMEFERGNVEIIPYLGLEEQNLHRALSSAISNRRFEFAVMLMVGLQSLYRYRGRPLEWQRLVQDLLDVVVDKTTNQPVPDFEEYWPKALSWTGKIAMEQGHFTEAHAALSQALELLRTRVAPFLEKPPADLSQQERSAISIYDSALHDFGTLQLEAHQPEAAATLEKSYEVSLALGDTNGAAISAFHLGHVYMDIVEIRDLTRSEEWYRKSLELNDDNVLRKASRHMELGQVNYARFVEMLKHNPNPDHAEMTRLLRSAAEYTHQALDMLPDDASEQRSQVLALLGNIYDDASETDRAVFFYQEAIRLSDGRNDVSQSSRLRREVARALMKVGRLQDALEYATEALRQSKMLGPGGERYVAMSKGLRDSIEEMIKAGPPV